MLSAFNFAQKNNVSILNIKVFNLSKVWVACLLLLACLKKSGIVIKMITTRTVNMDEAFMFQMLPQKPWCNRQSVGFDSHNIFPSGIWHKAVGTFFMRTCCSKNFRYQHTQKKVTQ